MAKPKYPHTHTIEAKRCKEKLPFIIPEKNTISKNITKQKEHSIKIMFFALFFPLFFVMQQKKVTNKVMPHAGQRYTPT